MPLADILAALDAEADEEIARIDADAQRQLAELRQDTSDAARHTEEVAAHERDDSAARRRAQIVNRARLVVERRMSAAIEEIYRELMAEVHHQLGAVRDRDDYPDLFRRLLDECRSVLTDGRVVRVDPADEELCRRVLASTGGDGFVVEGVLESAGGLELSTSDGRRSVRNTLESRTLRADRALRTLAAAEVPELRGGP